MPNIMAEEILNGSYGEVYIDGEFFGNFTEIEIKKKKNYQTVSLPGTRQIKHKLQSYEVTGTIRGFRVNDALTYASLVSDTDPDPIFTIEAYIKDPEGEEVKYRFNNVKFTSEDIFSFKTGELVSEEWEFVVDGEIERIE